MTKSLHELLQEDDPTELRRIERVLEETDVNTEEVEVCLSALKWIRSTEKAGGILGSVMAADCAERVARLADDLNEIGASAEAAAFEALRSMIPLPDSKIRNGLMDWIDTEGEITRQARQIDKQVGDISDLLWAYMQKNFDRLPDVSVYGSPWGISRLSSFFQ